MLEISFCDYVQCASLLFSPAHTLNSVSLRTQCLPFSCHPRVLMPIAISHSPEAQRKERNLGVHNAGPGQPLSQN